MDARAPGGLYRLPERDAGRCASPSATSPASPSDEETATNLDDLSARIEERAVRLINRRDLPLVVTQAEFQDVDEETAAGANAEPGTWWTMQMDDPQVTGTDSDLDTADLILYKPMEVLRDSLRPYIDELESVAGFILAFRDLEQTVFEITPEVMRRYIAGEIDRSEIADRIRISQLG